MVVINLVLLLFYCSRYGPTNPVKHIKVQRNSDGMYFLVDCKMFRSIPVSWFLFFMSNFCSVLYNLSVIRVNLTLREQVQYTESPNMFYCVRQIGLNFALIMRWLVILAKGAEIKLGRNALRMTWTYWIWTRRWPLTVSRGVGWCIKVAGCRLS